MLNKKSFYSSCFFLSVILLFILLSNSCQHNNSTFNVQHSTFNIKIYRYEQALFRLNSSDLQNGLKVLWKDYRFFLGDNYTDPSNIHKLQDYMNDPAIKQIYADCAKKYPDMKEQEKQLSEGLSAYKSLYPDAILPKIYTYISGVDYNTSVTFVDSVMVIPIDMYLGTSYEIYAKSGIPEFIRMRLNKEYISRDCMRQFAQNRVPKDFNPRNLLDYMILRGKLLYFTQALLKDMPDDINIAFTKEQLNWCKTNESNVWAFLINNKLLFSTDNTAITKFIDDAPFTSVISQQAPGRIGEWLGWQIVNAYMEKNKNISLPALMKESDAQLILNNSGYKPHV